MKFGFPKIKQVMATFFSKVMQNLNSQKRAGKQNFWRAVPAAPHKLGLRLVDASQAPCDATGILASDWSEHWRRHMMFISRQPIRGQAESAWPETVSAHPKRRRFPLKQQNLTALFGDSEATKKSKKWFPLPQKCHRICNSHPK